MISVGTISGSGHGEYYLNLAAEDYYLEGGEPPGIWLGSGARDLGLGDRVETDEFRNILQGFSPDGKKKLVQNAGRIDPVDYTDPKTGEVKTRLGRRAGWDLTVSAPKSFSTLWALSDEATQRKLEELEQNAVRRVVEYLEEVGGRTRTGRGGSEKKNAGIVVADFSHSTSRAQDPNRHHHLLVMNIAVQDSGATSSLDNTEIFRHRRVADAIYHAELASGIQREIGQQVRRERSWFEVEGIPKELIEAFSTRRSEILEELRRREREGETGTGGTARSRELANLATRRVKEHRARAGLFRDWRAVGERLGFDVGDIPRVAPEERFQREFASPRQEAEQIAAATDRLIENANHFSEKDLLREALGQAIEMGLDANATRRAVSNYVNNEARQAEHLPAGARAVPLGMLGGRDAYFTTQSVYDLEKEIVSGIERSRGQEGYVLPESAVRRAEVGRTLTAEQRDALYWVTRQTGSIQVVTGMAGTGKSYQLGAVREAYESSGYNVVGLALAGKAAGGLQEGSGIKSDTIAKLFWEMDHGRELFPIHAKTVVVVDEAAMVSNKEMARLIKETEARGAKLILVGDSRQLQAIQHGGAFKAAAKRLGHAELTDIRRQTGEDAQWQKSAIHDFSAGRGREALRAYEERGQLTVSNTRRQAIERSLSDWQTKGGATAPRHHLLISGTRAETERLNQRAQAIRKNESELGPSYASLGDQRFHPGDRVLFKRNDRFLGVRNGYLGTVVSASGTRLTVDVDGQKSVTVDLAEYKDLQLGYAITTHKAQGATVEGNVYVVAGGSMQDLHLSYVQASRAKERTYFYTDRKSAGEELTRLACEASRSREKTLTMDLAQEHEDRDRERPGLQQTERDAL